MPFPALKHPRTTRVAAATFISTLALSGGLAATATTGAPIHRSDASTQADVSQVLRVSTPTVSERNRLNRLGLDVTEAAGPGWVDVVAHSAADRVSLRRAGYSWTVVVADTKAAEAKRIAEDVAFAAAKPGGSGLPSGRTSYRVLADYDANLATLAADNPTRARVITLNHPSLEGRTVTGLEISNGVGASDGKPTLVLLGVHHAREWPSGELTIEFAYDLLANAATPRIANILDNARVVIVPVVNPDGFNVSRTDVFEMKRRNCRVTDGQVPAVGECEAAANLNFGVDPNRNYGGYWGGPGASASPTVDTYRGAGPFSEPETQNVRELISGRQVTTMITNHTYSNLVLRQPGYAGAATTPDETMYKALGDQMAAQMGYTSEYGYQLYDTTGTTEDWSYSATGGLGFTFEHGGNSFHPKFSNVVDLYLGAKKLAGKGAREAFLIAAESTINPARHSIISGTAGAGATLRLTKSFDTAQWSGTIPDTLTTTMVVPASGSYAWHVNPSTRPNVITAGGTEAWTLTCEVGGAVLDTSQVTVLRGASAVANLTC